MTVYRVQTAEPMPGSDRPRRLGMTADPVRAEEWRRSEEAALHVSCVVVPIEVTSPTLAGVEVAR